MYSGYRDGGLLVINVLMASFTLTNMCIQGVKQVKKTDLNARYLFLQPPSVEILEQRLRGRGTDKEEAIKERLAQATNEIEYSRTPGVHDQIIINDDLEKAWQEFKAFCVPESS